MDKNILEKYADIVIRQGVNLYKGQCLNITAGMPDYDFALILAESAYRAGAKFVEITLASNDLIKDRIKYSDKTSLDFLPQYKSSLYNEYIANDWASIRIDNTGESDVLKKADSEKLEIIFKADRNARKRFLDTCAKHKMTWCVIACPNEKWARKVFKDDSAEEANKKLDEALLKILRLDQADPVNAWKEHSEKLHKRCGVLNSLKLDKIVFKSAQYKTDLEIGLTDYSEFKGGPKATPDGRMFMPNIPTEEVFTTPHFARTNGIVYTVKPVLIMETVVNGVWFEFKDGRVMKFGSDNNDLLEKFLNTDNESRYLGETALVDRTSKIYESNLIFNSILYDENASCHIAIGNGYPSCLSNGQSLKTSDDLKNAGCNVSLVHTDFMIGSQDIEVTGISRDGKKHDIIKDGIFCI
jgi:aminopeptidase